MTRFALIAGSCLSLIPAAAVAQSREPMPAPAPAAATATPTVGATVLDSAGVSIGTIASITPQAIVLDMDGTKIAVPPTSVGATAKGLAMAMTKADLQAAQAQQQAAAQSRLVAGAAVAGLNGAPVGTIKSTSGDMVTMTTGKGDVVLPATGFTANATGQLIIGMTQAQLDAAMGGAGSAAATSSSTTSTGGSASSTTATPTSTTSTGVSGTADATGSATMTPPATPATTTAPAPKASVSTRTTTKVTTKKKAMTPK